MFLESEKSEFVLHFQSYYWFQILPRVAIAIRIRIQESQINWDPDPE
jgi:hypothetical protein